MVYGIKKQKTFSPNLFVANARCNVVVWKVGAGNRGHLVRNYVCGHLLMLSHDSRRQARLLMLETGQYSLLYTNN